MKNTIAALITFIFLSMVQTSVTFADKAMTQRTLPAQIQPDYILAQLRLTQLGNVTGKKGDKNSALVYLSCKSKQTLSAGLSGQRALKCKKGSTDRVLTESEQTAMVLAHTQLFRFALALVKVQKQSNSKLNDKLVANFFVTATLFDVPVYKMMFHQYSFSNNIATLELTHGKILPLLKAGFIRLPKALQLKVLSADYSARKDQFLSRLSASYKKRRFTALAQIKHLIPSMMNKLGPCGDTDIRSPTLLSLAEMAKKLKKKGDAKIWYTILGYYGDGDNHKCEGSGEGEGPEMRGSYKYLLLGGKTKAANKAAVDYAKSLISYFFDPGPLSDYRTENTFDYEAYYNNQRYSPTFEPYCKHLTSGVSWLKKANWKKSRIHRLVNKYKAARMHAIFSYVAYEMAYLEKMKAKKNKTKKDFDNINELRKALRKFRSRSKDLPYAMEATVRLCLQQAH